MNRHNPGQMSDPPASRIIYLPGLFPPHHPQANTIPAHLWPCRCWALPLMPADFATEAQTISEPPLPVNTWFLPGTQYQLKEQTAQAHEEPTTVGEQPQYLYQRPGWYQVLQKKTQALLEARLDLKTQEEFSFTRGQTGSRDPRP